MSVLVSANVGNGDATAGAQRPLSACESRRRWSAWRRERSQVKFERQQDALCSLSVSEKRRLFALSGSQPSLSQSVAADGEQRNARSASLADCAQPSVDMQSPAASELLPVRSENKGKESTRKPSQPDVSNARLPDPDRSVAPHDTADTGTVKHRRPNIRERRLDLARYGTQPITLAELQLAKAEFAVVAGNNGQMADGVLHEHTVSVRDALRKLHGGPTSSAPSARAREPLQCTYNRDENENENEDEDEDGNLEETRDALPGVGSLRQKLTLLNDASQDWRTRVRSENDAVQFTTQYKMQAIRDEPPADLDSPPATAQLPLASETTTERRLRMRPRRTHAARAQKCATVCIPEDAALGFQLPCDNQSIADLSIEVDRPAEKTIRGDALSHADRVVKDALSVKLDLDEETNRWRRSNAELRKRDSEDCELLFGPPCTLKTDSDWCALLVKGRRRVQVRLIAPASGAFSGGDSYVVVTRGAVFALLGAFSGVLERARAADAAKLIAARRELGYADAEQPNATIVDQQELATCTSFWHAISCSPHSLLEPLDDDDDFEARCQHETRVFQVETTQDSKTQLRLRALDSAPFSSKLLDSRKALLFQFGLAEFYIWFGKQFDFRLRSAAIRLASAYVRQNAPNRPSFALLAKLNEGSEPTLFVLKFSEWLRSDRAASTLRTDARRPSRLSSSTQASQRVGAPQMRLDQPLLSRMLHAKFSAPAPESSFVLNGDELRRGATWIEVQDEGVIRRLHDVTTLGVSLWLVDPKGMRLVPLLTSDDVFSGPQASFHLCEQNSYVVRWQFKLDGRILTQRALCWPHGDMMQPPARRESVGSAPRSRHDSTASSDCDVNSGRLCCAHFLWHGSMAPSQTRTAAAYLLCAMDSDKTPHCVVEQFREPPAFLRLFHSSTLASALFQHLGAHADRLRSSSYPLSSLFVLRHDYNGERVFLQVECAADSLLQDACYLLFTVQPNRLGGVLYWDAQRTELGAYLAELGARLAEERAQELWGALVSSAGVERAASWYAFQQAVRSLSCTSTACDAVDEPCVAVAYDAHARLRFFRFVFTPSSETGLNFDLPEVHSPLRRDEYAQSDREPRFPFTQDDLYDLNEQADRVLLIDAYQRAVFVWFAPQGSPPAVDGADSADEPSSDSFWNEHLRIAVQTALAYCDVLTTHGHAPASYLLFSGLEPSTFRRLFPFWSSETAARCSNRTVPFVAEAKPGCFVLDLQLAHQMLFSSCFSLGELRERRLSQASSLESTPSSVQSPRDAKTLHMRISVDARYLESYLTNSDFEEAFKMTRQQFYALPPWRQIALKKDLSLL